MSYSLQIARIISRAKALEFTEFKHPGLGVSFYNVDFSVLFNFPDLLKEAVKMMLELVKKTIVVSSIDYVGGVLTKGVVFSSILAYELKKPLVLFNRRGFEVYGGVKSGSNIILVDDVIMTGKTLSRCIKRVKEIIGGNVSDVIVILDRMYGGRELIEKKGVKVHALADIKGVADALLNLGEIGKEQHEVIRSEIRV